jgi:hypothetical protein
MGGFQPQRRGDLLAGDFSGGGFKLASDIDLGI